MNYYNKENIELHNGDCFNVIDELIKKNVTIDHIITDPPYNISKTNNFNTLSSPRKGIDFGEWDNDFDLFSWIPKFAKILNKNGSIIVFCSYRYISFIIRKMESSDFDVKDVIVWKKSNPMPRNINRRYVQDMEFAIWAVKKKSNWVFNKNSKLPYMRSLFETPTVLGNERTAHPTQKSLTLMEELIRIHTNENHIIIDPFMGSGTTGIACLKNNRKFIGIELEKQYYDIAIKRLKTIQTRMF